MPQVQADGKYEDRVRKWQGLASYVHIKKEDSSCCLVPEEQRGELARARQDSAQEPMTGKQDGGRGGCGERAGGGPWGTGAVSVWGDEKLLEAESSDGRTATRMHLRRECARV